MKYNQEEKELARELILKNAIKSLTNRKIRPYLIKPDYVRRVKEFLLKNGSNYDKKFAEILSEDNLKRWEAFCKSNQRMKSPAELKVAYFSGPSPENDLHILTKYGVLPENVWAFESENKEYNAAVISAMESEFPFIKIYKGKIQNFFKHTPVKFDIIYLDFCGTITSKESLPVIRELFYHQVLSSPGALITNFAFPKKENDIKKWTNTLKLCANYLVSKEFTERFEGLGGGMMENASALGLKPEQLWEVAKENPVNFYSQFITRIIFDMATVIVPYQRLYRNPATWKQFFKQDIEKTILPEDRNEELWTFPESHSLVTSLQNQLPFKDGVDPEELLADDNVEDINDSMDDAFSDFLTHFTNLLEIDGKGDRLLQNLDKLDFLLDEDQLEEYYSEKIDNISKKWKWESKYIFCDVFMFHQLKDLLVRQLSIPYHYNTKLSKRWTYQAKETQMFADLHVFEECRYLYDWMPTIDMIENSLSIMERQLILRFALDGVHKHSHWYNKEFLSGTAVVSMDQKGFEVLELKPRKKIN
jgi:hypothetical protein